jgi:hypothetical protein
MLGIYHQHLAHPFLSSSFVEKVKSDMTNNIPNSETWVYEINNSIIRFISMLNNEIVGLFVASPLFTCDKTMRNTK